MKYIIDCDPGIDDAIAIMMAHLYKLDIIGFTLVEGNVSMANVEKNIKIIEDFMKTNIPIYKGTPNEKSLNSAENVHGRTGLGYAVYPESRRVTEKKKAEDFLIKASKKYKDNLAIFCFGPLTNIANAIKKDKDFAKRIGKIYIMGASYNPNELPYLEFNISVDPESSKLVYNTEFKDMTVITHENGLDAVIQKKYIDTLKYSEKLSSNFVYQLSKKYVEFNFEEYGIDGMGMPDPFTVAVALDESVARIELAKIDVELEGTGRGQTIVHLNEGNAKLVTGVDNDKFNQMFNSVFN